jgi:hypothetical protein
VRIMKPSKHQRCSSFNITSPLVSLTSNWFRIPTAYCVPELQKMPRNPITATLICMLVSRRRARAGRISFVLCSSQSLALPKPPAFVSWRASAQFLNTVGRRYISIFLVCLSKAHIHVLQLCTLCGESGGAVIRCSDCSKEFHTSCAWKNGYKFGFEMQPVRVHPPLAWRPNRLTCIQPGEKYTVDDGDNLQGRDWVYDPCGVLPSA